MPVMFRLLVKKRNRGADLGIFEGSHPWTRSHFAVADSKSVEVFTHGLNKQNIREPADQGPSSGT